MPNLSVPKSNFPEYSVIRSFFAKALSTKAPLFALAPSKLGFTETPFPIVTKVSREHCATEGVWVAQRKEAWEREGGREEGPREEGNRREAGGEAWH